jgi:hypothetical protein
MPPEDFVNTRFALCALFALVVTGLPATAQTKSNTLRDVPGPDLYVFEGGPAIEGMRLAISTDGSNWTDAGNISGGAEVDISTVARPGERYPYVKVADLKSGCGGQYPGADIDAVGAIGAAFQISLDADAYNMKQSRAPSRCGPDVSAGRQRNRRVDIVIGPA